jgi:transposase-like protein
MIEFQEKYGTEEQCWQHLSANRWPEGFRCPKCENKEYFNVQSRRLYQCKQCNYQASVTAGTIFDKTRTPLVKWFTAIYLTAEDKRGISALTLKKKIGVAYFTAWTMLHKIRHAVGERDEKYRLCGTAEIDEAFFGAPTAGGKRGRGTDKTPVLAAVSLSEAGKPKYARMEVAERADSSTAEAFTDNNVLKGSKIHTDGLNIYNSLAEKGYLLKQVKYDPEKQPEHLHWLHIIVSNAEAFIAGTYHGLDKKHLQSYLNEFCYRFNRRHLESFLFSKLVFACASSSKITFPELIR